MYHIILYPFLPPISILVYSRGTGSQSNCLVVRLGIQSLWQVWVYGYPGILSGGTPPTKKSLNFIPKDFTIDMHKIIYFLLQSQVKNETSWKVVAKMVNFMPKNRRRGISNIHYPKTLCNKVGNKAYPTIFRAEPLKKFYSGLIFKQRK